MRVVCHYSIYESIAVKHVLLCYGVYIYPSRVQKLMKFSLKCNGPTVDHSFVLKEPLWWTVIDSLNVYRLIMQPGNNVLCARIRLYTYTRYIYHRRRAL